MKPRRADSLHLDVEVFAEQARRLDGSRPLGDLTRLADVAHPESQPTDGDRVEWHARGERRASRGGPAQTWLHLEASTRIALTCQRCLEPIALALDVRRSFRFVESEEAAAELDAESEDDVLGSSRSFDLAGLIEDELVLALPLVPRHADCRMPAAPDSDRLAFDSANANPFAGLAALKTGRRLG